MDATRRQSALLVKRGDVLGSAAQQPPDLLLFAVRPPVQAEAQGQDLPLPRRQGRQRRGDRGRQLLPVRALVLAGGVPSARSRRRDRGASRRRSIRRTSWMMAQRMEPTARS